MRMLRYRVKDNKGNEFITASYAKAIEDGNHIVEHLLIKEEYEDEKLVAARKERARKTMEKFGIKRG